MAQTEAQHVALLQAGFECAAKQVPLTDAPPSPDPSTEGAAGGTASAGSIHEFDIALPNEVDGGHARPTALVVGTDPADVL